MAIKYLKRYIASLVVLENAPSNMILCPYTPIIRAKVKRPAAPGAGEE